MRQKEIWKQENEEIRERYELCMERVRAIKEETSVSAPFYAYFQEMADFIIEMAALAEGIQEGRWGEASLEVLQD